MKKFARVIFKKRAGPPKSAEKQTAKPRPKGLSAKKVKADTNDPEAPWLEGKHSGLRLNIADFLND